MPVRQFLNSWKTFTSGSVNRQIFGAAATVALMTVLVKLAAVVKELVVAWRFGTGDDLEAFFIAWLVPSFAVNVVAGSFNAALIPTYIKVREQKGLLAAQKLFSGVMVWSLGLLAITTIAIVGTASLYLPGLASGFSPEKLTLTFYLLYAIAPIVLLNGIGVIWGALLNAGERFALAAVSAIITPATSILFLLFFPGWGVYALGAGLVCGAVLELTILGAALKRQGISLLPKWYGFDDHLRQVAGQYAPMIAGAFLMSGTNLVDQSMAAMLSPGSVAALNYGSKLIALPLNLGANALGTAVIPYFSRMVASQDYLTLKDTLYRYLKQILIWTIPFTLVIIMISEPLVKILFQRGAFSAESTPIVSQVQACYAFQIPFYISGILVVRLISSLRSNTILLDAAAFNLLLNVVLNYGLSHWLGVAGIALSTSCVMMFSFGYLMYRSLKIMG